METANVQEGLETLLDTTVMVQKNADGVMEMVLTILLEMPFNAVGAKARELARTAKALVCAQAVKVQEGDKFVVNKIK